MNCEKARELAALAASGDVTPAELSALESHTALCAECHAETEAFEVICGQLAAMLEESAPEHVYSAVRARVSAEITHRRRPGWVAAWAGLAVAVACALLMAITLRSPLPVAKQLPVPAPALVEVAGVQTESPGIFVQGPKRRMHKTAVRADTRVATEPLVVHMFTDDPDVVIYWIADARGSNSKKEMIR